MENCFLELNKLLPIEVKIISFLILLSGGRKGGGWERLVYERPLPENLIKKRPKQRVLRRKGKRINFDELVTLCLAGNGWNCYCYV